MLEQFNFSVQQYQNNLDYIVKQREKYKKRLEDVEEMIVIKKDLEAMFVQKDLQNHTEYVKETQDIELAKIISSKFIEFLGLLTVPFKNQNYQIQNILTEILQSQNIQQYKKQITESLKFRLHQYQEQLQQKNSQTVFRLHASNVIPIISFQDIKYNLSRQQEMEMISIICRDSNLSRAYQQLDQEYESKLLSGLFKKIYDVTKNTTILSETYVTTQILSLFFHIEQLFEKNKNLLRKILSESKPTYYLYTIRQLYKYLVIHNFNRIIQKYKSTLTNQGVVSLIQIMLDLQNKLKNLVNTDKLKIISERQSVLVLIFQKQHAIFSKIVQEQKESLVQIIKNPKLSNIKSASDLQEKNSTFITKLGDFYLKYLDLSFKYKQQVNKYFTEPIGEMMRLSVIDLQSLLKNSDTLEAKYRALESFSIIESWYISDKVISQIRKNNKQIQLELEAVRMKAREQFQKLISDQYALLKKKLDSDTQKKTEQDYEKLYEQKKVTDRIKNMFLERMRQLFFRFIKKEDSFTKDRISRLLDLFEPYLEQSIGEKFKQIRKVIESGNVISEYKKLGFLKKEEREDISKIKLNY